MTSRKFVNAVYAVFFCPLKTSILSSFEALGRDVLSCGLLFHLLEETDRRKFELFMADTSARSFKWYDHFYIPPTHVVLDGYKVSRDSVQGLLISDDAETVDRIYRVCRGCHEVSKDYNNMDRLLTAFVPFYQPPDDTTIFTAKSLHSAQAIILILKECLAKDSAVKGRIEGLNSRIATPQSLRDVLHGLPSPHQLNFLLLHFTEKVATGS